MANPNHVHDDSVHVHNGQNIYADPEFNPQFPGTVNPSFDPSAYNLYSTTAPQQTWQQPTISRPASALGAPYEASNQFYGRPFSNSPLQFQDQPFRHANINSYSQQPAVDPSLVSSSMRQPSYDLGMRNMMPTSGSPSTISPQALQTTIRVKSENQPSLQNIQNIQNIQQAGPAVQEPTTKPAAQSYGFQQSAPPAKVVVPVNPSIVTPKGELQGKFMVKNLDELVKATKSVRLHHFVTLSDITLDLPLNKTTVPNYTPRKSKREIKILAANDKQLSTKITKKSGKKSSTALRAPRIRTAPSSAQSPTNLKREYSDSASETESSDDSDYSSDEETPEPSPLPDKRPEEPKAAVEYDVTEAVWLPPKSSARPEQIRTALVNFWEVVRTIRDRWRLDNAAVKQAEEKKRVSELPMLKSRVGSQQAMMEVALKTALEHGHPDIVHHLSENKPFLLLLYQFIADRITSKDYDGVMVGVILELLSRCSTLTNAKLEESKLSKVFTIMSKPGKGNDKTKAQIKQILAKVAASPETKVESPAQKSGDTKDNIKATQPTTRPSAEPLTGTKRPRTADVTSGEPAKRVASGLNKPVTSATTKPPTNGLKRPGERSVAPTNTASKPKVNPLVAKPTSLFSNLQSAPKRPGAQPVAKLGAQSKPAANALNQKKAATAPPMRSSAPAFSFAETMANLMKPKEPEVVAKPEEKRPPETPEEKARRLRKESRRHLRVAFRPDATLVSVRYFSHDPEEEVGHDASMVRDAGDVGGEGRMFKQHKDMDMDEEDDDLPREESFRDWIEPSEIDFSVIAIEERKRNYPRSGGGLNDNWKFPEKEENERREANTLMVFYAQKSDIPPSPREPPEPAESAPAEVVEFGPPPQEVLNRAAAFAPVSVQPPVQDLAAIFNMMAQQPQQPQQQPVAPTSQLESIFAQFAAKTEPAPQQAPPTNIYSILGALQQPQAPQQVPQMPQYPSAFAVQPPPQAPATPDVSALLATLLSSGQQNNAAPQMPFNMPYSFANMGQQPQGQHQQQSAVYENEERKRWRENGGGYQEPPPPERAPEREHSGSFKKGKNKNKGGSGGFQKPHKVHPCRFFQEGKCAKGDACTYIHDPNDIRKR
ncbi:uncharacterized protein BDZ99DRAFT_474354 [Mytilinidion resinicola]|uniref:C3H1-type domain-containing protein n=1 Tax=Mytilinidion resinicola TaxID=574789 RepID=A0A6A6YVV5_9PEZI|nr:uncharacterized protein BDZ99DRAFT_474354 [Mytilinidion resinicola]KAF2812124.1 hypothetical protein BDZ99DRAFT_474354 [Mytilinidion resinicola]